jgi:hypothetical protein
MASTALALLPYSGVDAYWSLRELPMIVDFRGNYPASTRLFLEAAKKAG